jgi:CheY-like chemotaxis protein
LILTDLRRPGLTGESDPRAGLELLRILAQAANVPPIVVYALQLDERAEEAERYGARAVTNTPSDLLRAVLDVLRS